MKIKDLNNKTNNKTTLSLIKHKKKVVCIGGGTGQSILLENLKDYDLDITAIVTVLDSGRSTGVIRDEFSMVAPGDIRNCIISLSESEKEFKDLFQYRFKKYVEGMSLGNLLIAALTEKNKNFADAIDSVSKLFRIKGKVYPSTLSNTHICAELIDGKKICGEVDVRTLNKPKIKKVFLKNKNAKGYSKSIKALMEADYIIISPGSLYTSILSNFIINDIKKAFILSKAKKIFIPNLATQPGQTDNLTLQDHIDEMLKYMQLPNKNSKDNKKSKSNFNSFYFDYIIINTKKPSSKILNIYKKAGANYLEPLFNVSKKTNIISGNFIVNRIKKEWNKGLYLRHDGKKLINSLVDIIFPKKSLKGVILAAGSGSRMKPFSISTSKVMLKFLGKPLLAYHVDEMEKEGIEDFVIICNKRNKKSIESYFTKNYSHLNFEYPIQEKQKGPANALLSAKKYLIHSFFILKYGDSLSFENQIKGIIETYEKSRDIDAIVTLRDVENPSEYGIAKFEEGKLVEIVEKPKSNPPSKLANVGLAILNADKFFNSLKKHGFKEVLPPPQYLLLDKCNVSYWISRSERVDVGRAYNILEANKMLLEKYGSKVQSIHISKTAKISNTCYISANSVIEDNVKIIGHCSIDGYISKGSIIKNSVIMEGTKIGKSCLIEDSVIGKFNIIEDKFKVKSKKAKIYIKNKYLESPFPVGIFTGNHVFIKKKIKALPGKIIFPNKIISNNIKNDKITRAILFDADNTIYNTKNIAKFGDTKVMEYFENYLNLNYKKLYSEWKKIVSTLSSDMDPKKRHRKYSYNLLLEKYKSRLSNLKLINKLVNDAFEIFLNEISKKIKLLPYFRELLPTLDKYKLAIFSEDSSDLLFKKLKTLNIESYFSVIISSDDIGEMKPSMKYYELVFKKLKLNPHECMVVGDNYNKDLLIPKKLGAKTTLITFNPEKTLKSLKKVRSIRSKTDYFITDYKNFTNILKEV